MALSNDINFSELSPDGSYTFSARKDEFPLRLSIYMAQGKRGHGARYTLGHCVLAAEDLGHICADGQQVASARTTMNKLAAIQAPVSSFQSSDEQEEARQDDLVDKWQLEYRLHQTILEAIKSTV